MAAAPLACQHISSRQIKSQVFGTACQETVGGQPEAPRPFPGAGHPGRGLRPERRVEGAPGPAGIGLAWPHDILRQRARLEIQHCPAATCAV